MAEYQLSNQGRIRVEAGLGRANPYNAFVHDIGTTDNHISQAHSLLSFERSGLLLRGWWNGVFSNTPPINIFPPLTPLFAITDKFGQTTGNASLNTYDLETRYQFNPLETLKLNLGTNFRHIVASWNILDTRTIENRLGLYAQGSWLVLPSLEVNTGLRYDLDSFHEPTLSPRGSLTYRVHPNHTIRFSASVAYRPPTTFEVGQHSMTTVTLPGLPPSSSVTLGSSSVNPEKIVSYEAGYQGWWWEHRLRTRVTGFFNQIRDLIVFRNPTNNPFNPAIPINANSADMYGGEVGVEVLITSWLSGFANYAYQGSMQRSGEVTERGFPHHKVNAGLRVTWDSFKGEVIYHHVGMASYPLSEPFTNLAPFFPPGTLLPQEQVPAYNLLNLRLGYLLWRQQTGDDVREAELALSVFNALNDTHREHPLGDLLGTRVMGWLTVKL